MSATDDAAVARLAELLREAADKRAMPGVFGTFSTRMLAEELLKRGVTLPPAPVATPLEAAAKALAHANGEALVDGHRDDVRAILTAAVGALSDEAAQAIWWAYQKTDTQPEGAEALRSVALARLTEGGAA